MFNIKKIIKEEYDKILKERDTFDVTRTPSTTSQLPTKAPVPSPVRQKPVAKVVPKPSQGPIKPPVKPGIPRVPVAPKKPSIPMKKTEYQIFNIKMRINKLGLNTLTSRFNQSLKDFDLNISKNNKDAEKINNYLLPVMGNLEALKNALESLDGEFEKLKDIIGEYTDD